MAMLFVAEVAAHVSHRSTFSVVSSSAHVSYLTAGVKTAVKKLWDRRGLPDLKPDKAHQDAKYGRIGLLIEGEARAHDHNRAYVRARDAQQRHVSANTVDAVAGSEEEIIAAVTQIRKLGRAPVEREFYSVESRRQAPCGRDRSRSDCGREESKAKPARTILPLLAGR